MMPLDIAFIAHQLGKAKRVGNGWSCLCPAHDDHHPSLSLSMGQDGRVLAWCYVGCSFSDILSALRKRGLLEKRDLLGGRDIPPQPPKASEGTALRIWREAVSAEGSPVQAYLRGRGYNGGIPPTLRFHPKLFHHSRTYHPAMVAAITLWPCKTISGIHRTYLTADGSGKASLDPNKMMLGPTKGGAIRLAPPGPKLILAEGIETALSCFYATNIPTWSCLSTSGMVEVVVPPCVITQDIIICADGDPAGQRAANKLAARLHKAGYGVRIAPSPPGQDFNDVLRREI